MLHLLLAFALAAPLDSALLTAGEVAPDCQLVSTQPLDPRGGAAQLDGAESAMEQLLTCQGDLGIVDYFEMGRRADDGARQLQRARWGGPQPPARLHDGLLRRQSVLADVSGSRAVAFLLQTRLQAKDFHSLGDTADFGAIAQAMGEERAEHAPPITDRVEPVQVGAVGRAGGAIEWRGYEDGLREAAASRRPVCLYFFTGWCPHCRNFERQVLRNPAVIEKSKAFVMVKLDDEQDDELASRYAPDGRYFPRLLFLSPDGELDPSITNGSAGRSRYTASESDPKRLLWTMDQAIAKLAR